MGRVVLFLTFLMLAASLPAVAQNSCLPDYLAAQTLVHVSEGKTVALTLPLKDQNANGEFMTKVQVDAKISPEGIHLTAHFNDGFQGVSLPYNLYSVLILRNGQPLEWLDFTNLCQGPGIGFFPGRHVDLPLVKFDGAKGGDFQIMIWGRL
jgi:hypothetical protein